jgi:hypothetical protein
VTDTVRIRFPALRNVLSLVWREADRLLRAQNPPPRPPAPTAARVETMSSGGQHGWAVLSADSAFKSI